MGSSLLKKFLMALSAVFLLVFLTQHLLINITSVFNDQGKTFNMLSHFMGYNPIVQYVLQPVLMGGVIFHFLMGFILEFQNRNARGAQNYIIQKQSNKSSWSSRNMIISGLVILSFLILHLIDFWVYEMNYKYIKYGAMDEYRYFGHLQHQFSGNLLRVGSYVVSFIFLGLHLSHGFSSAFQSMGLRNKYYSAIVAAGNIYAILIPFGYIFIAFFHFFSAA